MILTGSEIHRRVEQGDIVIRPYGPENLNPNSYNFHLGNELKVYKSHTLDCAKPNHVESIKIPDSGFMLQPNRIYLGCTHEVMGSSAYVPIIKARSSIARLGLFIHVTADLIDIGSVNQWTLQLHAVQPIRIYPGMSLGQVTFWLPTGKIELYDGKYQGSRGPQESQLYRDFALVEKARVE